MKDLTNCMPAILTTSLVIALTAVIGFALANSSLFLNSRIDRLGEDGLPSIVVEDGTTMYCRMQADDFRFPLPPGASPVGAHISSGGFDTVEGTVSARFVDGDGMSAAEYENWLRQGLQEGGRVTASREIDSPNLLIRFSYFGDR